MNSRFILLLLCITYMPGLAFSEDLDVKANQLEVFNRGKELLYKGDVRAKRGGMDINSKLLKNLGEDYFFAEQDVYMVDKSSSGVILEGWGERLDFWSEKSKAVLTGHPRIKYNNPGESIDVNGEKIIFWKDDNRIEIISGAHASVLVK